jgi:amidase
MTELANWIAQGMPNNYNAVVGFAMNPYDPRRDPRAGSSDGRCVLDTGGSSSGAGTAASFWAASVGTETSGSIISPANQNMLVGIKPTVGRISRYGVIPITADQDTPGPMARTVADAAILLGVLEGAADSRDAATSRCDRAARNDYTVFLKKDALKGARIGVARVYPDGQLNPDESARMAEALTLLKREGAVIVDPADVPTVAGADAVYRRWPICAGAQHAKGRDAGCSIVLKYGMKRDFNAWLRSLGAAAPVKTLTEFRAWNRAHAAEGALKFGQAELDISDEMDVEADRARYNADRARDLQMTGQDGIDAVMKEHRLDALLFPSLGGYDIPARAGYPSVIVPFGFITESAKPAFPKDFDPKPTPFGVMFAAGACSEPRLISIAYAFEQATKGRVPPPQFP